MEVIRTNTNSERKKVRNEILYSVVTYVVVITFLAVVNYLSSSPYPWVIWPALGWGVGLALGIIGKYKRINRYDDGK